MSEKSQESRAKRQKNTGEKLKLHNATHLSGGKPVPFFFHPDSWFLALDSCLLVLDS